jgi:hypothetical protein
MKGVSNVTTRSGSPGTALTRRRCPPFPHVPIAVAVLIVVAVAIAIAVGLTMILAGHPVNLASGIVWA